MKRKLLAMVLAVSMTCGVTAGSSMIGFAEETEVVTEAATEALTDDAEAAEITADPADEDYYPVTMRESLFHIRLRSVRRRHWYTEEIM